MPYAMWARLLFLTHVIRPHVYRHMPGIGPVRVYRGIEMALHDAIFTRIDFDGGMRDVSYTKGNPTTH